MYSQIAIYNENSPMRGTRCWDDEMIENDSPDITIHTAESAEDWAAVKELAEAYLNTQRLGGGGAFDRRVGKELMDWYKLEGGE